MLVDVEQLFLGKGDIHHAHHAGQAQNAKAAKHLHHAAHSAALKVNLKSAGFLFALVALLACIHLLFQAQKQCGKPNGKIGKIDADALNKKDVQQLLRKVSGGCLIIERAGALSRESAVTLSLLLEQETSGTFVILEDTAVGIKKALMADDGFAKKFTESVTVPIFTNDDLIVFAKSYANELGYVIDEMAILALHNRISNIERIDQATTLVEVKDIIDEAIEREARGGIRKAFNILTAKRYTDDDKIVLTEKDFE